MENEGDLTPQRKFVVLLAEGECMLESKKKKQIAHCKSSAYCLEMYMPNAIITYPLFVPAYFDLWPGL